MISKKMMGTMAVLGMMLAGGTIANAQTRAMTQTGETPVTYDNRVVLPDDNGQYGMVIPTAISLTDAKKKADASVEIIGINGYDLANWSELEVEVTINSNNDFNLVKDTKKIPYTVTMNSNQVITNTSGKVQKIFGVGGTAVEKVTGEAKLIGKAVEKGQYSDELTYTFNEVKNTLK